MDSWWALGETSGHDGSTMQTWRLRCPFCSEKGNFGIANHAEKKKPNSSKKLNFDLYQCRNCMAYVHVLWSANEFSASIHDFKVLPWPLDTKPEPSENWPPDVQRFWPQAHDSLGNENWDAAAIMARSALQAAMRQQGAQGKNLKEEIDDLASKGILHPLMKDWSHEVRQLANESAHPKSGTGTEAEDAGDIVSFLDVLLTYLYDFPKQIEDYRKRRNTNPKP